MLAIKVFENNKPIDYISREYWQVTKSQEDALMLDEKDIVEAKRIARRFWDGYDEECNMECKVVKFEIIESELGSNV